MIKDLNNCSSCDDKKHKTSFAFHVSRENLGAVEELKLGPVGVLTTLVVRVTVDSPQVPVGVLTTLGSTNES